MRHFVYFLFFFIAYSTIISEKLDEMESIQSFTNELKTKYAPDKRTALFDIEVTNDENKFFITGETNIKIAFDELAKYISTRYSSVENSVKLLPDENLGKNIFGVVNISVANMRTQPEHPAELATQALLGTVVNVLKRYNGWYLVQTPDNYIAWVDDDAIVMLDRKEKDDLLNSNRVIYTKISGTVNSEPNSNSLQISDIVIGAILRKIDVSNDYIKVQFPDGRIGYIEESSASNFDEWLNIVDVNSQSIVETSMHYLGVPYLWGGTSAKGVDCSGFTKTIYFLNGIVLPRDASQQVFSGKLINTNNGFDELLPGDLLFFGEKASGNKKERITHVGIYIGNLKYIHSSGMVRINSLDANSPSFNQYRYNSFVKAKRIIDNYTSGASLIKDNLFFLNK